MNADEKLVMDTWDSPRFDWSYQHGDPSKPKYWLFYIGDWLVISGYDTREQIEASAAEFTRDRLEEIRQVEEEIRLLEGYNKSNKSCSENSFAELRSREQHATSFITVRRTIVRLHAALAELKKGMK